MRCELRSLIRLSFSGTEAMESSPGGGGLDKMESTIVSGSSGWIVTKRCYLKFLLVKKD